MSIYRQTQAATLQQHLGLPDTNHDNALAVLREGHDAYSVPRLIIGNRLFEDVELYVFEDGSYFAISNDGERAHYITGRADTLSVLERAQ